MRRTIALTLLAAAALGLTACGEKARKPDQAEEFIRGVVTKQVQARVASVRCPKDYETDVGSEFICVVRGADGSEGDVNATQQKRSVISVSAPFLHVREVEAVMTRQIERRTRRDDVAVDCPEIVTVTKGALFKCRLTSDATTRNVNVRLTDSIGHFRYTPPDLGEPSSANERTDP
ncbi:MAG TPA: DUF4333 domain-containing protein [Solirubrobacteraceae bacterium]|nr:DUF4333 domain-containing protein [Solirubrobacteraceae bacterium]